MPLRYWTAGESHGKAMLGLVDGFPEMGAYEAVPGSMISVAAESTKTIPSSRYSLSAVHTTVSPGPISASVITT